MTHKIINPLSGKLLALTTIGFFSLSLAHAEVTLKVDDNIKVTAINGQQTNTSAFQPIKKEFTLEAGKHVISAKYDRLYEFRGDDHDYLRSGNLTVTAELQDNQTYRLAMPGQPEKYQEAKKYAKSPTLAVMKGNQIVAQTQNVSEKSGLFSKVTSIFGSNDAQLENQKVISSINSNDNSSQSQNSAIAPQSPNSNQANTLDRFMQLWLQATPDEREKIRQWIK